MKENTKIGFEIDVSQIKIASGEESISETIETLLSLNDKIPAQTDREITDLTEKQLNSEDYMNKGSRGEEEEITEFQFGDRKDEEPELLEVKLQNTSPSDGGHRPEAWDNADVKMRGHKNIPNIWQEVYRKEDDRKKAKNPLKKKLKK